MDRRAEYLRRTARRIATCADPQTPKARKNRAEIFQDVELPKEEFWRVQLDGTVGFCSAWKFSSCLLVEISSALQLEKSSE